MQKQNNIFAIIPTSKSFFIKKQARWTRKLQIARAMGDQKQINQYCDWLAELEMTRPWQLCQG